MKREREQIEAPKPIEAAPIFRPKFKSDPETLQVQGVWIATNRSALQRYYTDCGTFVTPDEPFVSFREFCATQWDLARRSASSTPVH